MTLAEAHQYRNKFFSTFPGLRRWHDSAGNHPSPETRTFCETLAHAGCRISEALRLTADRVDVSEGVLVFECLKKRRRGIYRAVPVPPEFLQTLQSVHDLAALGEQRLWAWSRTTGWRRVKQIMDAANIHGPYATPKGVRHGFGIKAVTSDVPLNMTSRWLGHTTLATTSIYTDAVGPEEVSMLKTVGRFLELIRFSHTLFALPFALMSALLAWHAKGSFQIVELVGILACMVFARCLD